MILRLSFAVATCFEPGILLMDEWILAGDAHFMGKAEARVQSFVERASVMVLASHNLELCSRWCTRGIWLDQGSIRELGPIDQVIRRYQDFVSGITTH
jgi:ABC-2 type transport system ATP-binding protein/lipopolysaccharide transport system ATP-binding protein